MLCTTIWAQHYRLWKTFCFRFRLESLAWSTWAFTCRCNPKHGSKSSCVWNKNWHNLCSIVVVRASLEKSPVLQSENKMSESPSKLCSWLTVMFVQCPKRDSDCTAVWYHLSMIYQNFTQCTFGKEIGRNMNQSKYGLPWKSVSLKLNCKPLNLRMVASMFLEKRNRSFSSWHSNSLNYTTERTSER